MEKVFAVVYAISVFWMVLGLYSIKKTEIKLSGVNFISVAVFSFFCYQTALAGLLQMIGIEVGNKSLGILNILVGCILWYFIIKKECRQKYYFNKWDAVANAIMILAILVLATRQFGKGLNIFNYQCTWDSSVHLSWAREAAKQHSLPGMYFNALNMGVWLECVYAFVPYATGCELYIITDLVTLVLDAGLFWCLIRRYINDKSMYIVGIVCVLAYVFGYPLNNMVFGTSYLGSGNLCVIFVVLLYDIFKMGKANKVILGLMLMLTVFSLIKSYVLFLPVVLISIYIYIFVFLYEKGKITRNGLMAVVILSAAVAAGGYAVLKDYFWNAISGLALEGQIYRNLATNFVLFIPFILFVLVKKYRTFLGIMLIVTLGYIAVFMACVLNGKVSGYYYFKNYYVLWFLSFYNAFIIVSENINRQNCVKFYIAGCSLLAVFSVSKVENKLGGYTDPWYGQVFGESRVSSLFDIYNFNFDNMAREAVDTGTRELFGEVARMNSYVDETIFYVGIHDYAIHKVFYALANQPEINTDDVASPEDYIRKIKETSKYVCVLEPERDTWDITDYLSTLEVVYKNDKGYIAKVQ